ncbi:binding-protein-dependent transport systems inner membrane component [Micromonospora qiuiae]|uniref:Binding-protein-dependent transport systems inner membrane component n=1 Tax=Micromonospora qiuiae TaxID=502268 RepID=A0ABQ4JI73_9ACTN|nr:carbohydrate ABC transporter permease [Micromonospora qiuiae]GIJ30310.1 binding-protein-dependent transport systems inner membrane component [Micromonospora qiuiae]
MPGKRSWVARIVLFVFLVWSLFPIYWLLTTSFKAPTEVSKIPPRWLPQLDLSAYTTALASPDLQASLLNSFVVALGATTIAVACGVLAGYALGQLATTDTARYEFWVLTSRMAPPIAVALPFFLMFRVAGLQDTLVGVTLAHVVLVVGVVSWILIETFRGLPPALLESALLDGCSYASAFRRVLLPLSMPGIVGAGSIAFLLSWNEFFLSLILTDVDARTSPLALYQYVGFQSLDLGQLAAASCAVLVPTALVVGFFQRQLVTGLTMGAVKE